MRRIERSWRGALKFGLALVLGACFGGEFVQGLPCTNDAECGPTLACIEQVCGGLGDPALCGNGLVDVGEECDDGGLANGDACTPSCRLPVCGDGYRSPGESCDDGNALDGDGCSSTCTLCGDGLIEDGEACDDGNTDAGDFCTPACRLPVCGDGYLGPNEQCDDGNELGTDTCTPTCQLPTCGDGFVNAAGESCDDGNTVDNDECTTACTESPEAPTLELSLAQVKKFEFHWQPALGADYYQLLERADGEGEFVQVGGDIVGESFSLTVPLHLRADAGYQLRACNANRCAQSATLDTVGSLAEAVGYFKASNTGGGDNFGQSVALSGDGDTLAVGAPYEDSAGVGVNAEQDDNSASKTGAVYIFVRTGEGWSQQAYLKASNSGNGDWFGASVALSNDGDTLVVGAPSEESAATDIDGDQSDNSAEGAGAAYVFVRTGESWVQQAYVKASNSDEDDYFGYSVALSKDGDALAVGAPGEASAGTGVDADQASDAAASAGAVYMFVRTNDSWSQDAYIKASNTGAEDHFGASVALAGDGQTLVAGAPDEDGDTKFIDGPDIDLGFDLDIGAAYVFAWTDGGWSQQAYIKANNTSLFDKVGSSVALSEDGNILAVGQPAGVFIGSEGSVSVFVRSGDAWASSDIIKASNSAAAYGFGSNVALTADGDTLIVGSPGEISGTIGVNAPPVGGAVVDAGAAYVFERSGESWSELAYVKASNTWEGYEFGVVAVSADGLTLAVGAPGESSSAMGIAGPQNNDALSRSGAVYVY